jgi:hypothetical protein
MAVRWLPSVCVVEWLLRVIQWSVESTPQPPHPVLLIAFFASHPQAMFGERFVDVPLHNVATRQDVMLSSFVGKVGFRRDWWCS